MSEETNAFTAYIYINGKKIGYCKNTGQGGCTNYDAIEPENRKTIADAEVYCKALPKTKWKTMEFDQSLESVIDTLLEDWLKAKETKKFEKKMNTCILIGSPDENRNSYSYFNFKKPLSEIPEKPLSEIPVNQLQASIGRIKAKLQTGEIILNTNLSALGVNV